MSGIRSGLQAAVLAACTIMAQPAAAQPAPGVTATNPWARATTPGVSTGGIYVTLTSPAGDRLVSATSPAAAKADVHEMQMNGDIMRMRELKGGLPLPPGQAVTLGPSGTHIMLEGLKAPLTRGSVVPVHLMFEKAPPIDIQAPVQSIGASGPAAGPPTPATMPGMTMSK